MIDRDFDLDGVRLRDTNWDPDRVGLRLRDGYRVRVINTDRYFHRVGSVNWDLDFNREGLRDRDLDTNRVGFRDLDSFGDYPRGFLSGVETPEALTDEAEAAVRFSDPGEDLRNVLPEVVWVQTAPAVTVAVDWETPLGGVALCGCRNCLGGLLWSPVGPRDDGQRYGEDAELWESRRLHSGTAHFGRFRDCSKFRI
jgi:hypothetical protein